MGSCHSVAQAGPQIGRDGQESIDSISSLCRYMCLQNSRLSAVRKQKSMESA